MAVAMPEEADDVVVDVAGIDRGVDALPAVDAVVAVPAGDDVVTGLALNVVVAVRPVERQVGLSCSFNRLCRPSVSLLLTNGMPIVGKPSGSPPPARGQFPVLWKYPCGNRAHLRDEGKELPAQVTARRAAVLAVTRQCRGIAMRRVGLFALLLILSSALAGCDKCGDWPWESRSAAPLTCKGGTGPSGL